MITVKELQQQIYQHFQELVDETDKARSSDEMLQYLDCCAKFHTYSPNNIWLILLARPDASYVAGFHKWKSMGRWVRKGERGIPIFAPLIHNGIDENDKEQCSLFGFKIVHVFDVQQTDGEPLPPQPDWKSPAKSEELNLRLIEYAKSQGISVTFKDLNGEVQGVSKGGVIEIDHSAGTKTFIHELAHELLHQGGSGLQSRALRELEAESVAYVVAKHFHLPCLNCPKYLLLHGIDKEQLVEHMGRVQDTASDVIQALEGEGQAHAIPA